MLLESCGTDFRLTARNLLDCVEIDSSRGKGAKPYLTSLPLWQWGQVRGIVIGVRKAFSLRPLLN